MDGLETIFTRRSIRKYSDQKIDDDVFVNLVKAAVSAPSAGNQQPWQFIIISDKKKLERVLEFHPHAKMLLDAQGAILICGDLSKEKHKGYWVLDCAAATENILLAAHATGFGACWLGIFPREERVAGMKSLVEVPDHVIPFALVSLGFPDEQKNPSDRYDESLVHYNMW